MPRIYLDNAATSFPKPPTVTQAMVRFAEDIGASPGRGGYAESMQAGAIVKRCRERLCRLTNTTSPDHVIFTLNATDALNLAIKGVIRAWRRRHPVVHAISTDMDHNSILRPLNALRDEGLEWTCLRTDATTGRVDPDTLRRTIRPDTALVAINHASNVTGAIQDLAPVIEICRQSDVLLVVDAAQSLGHIPVDAADIDLLAFPGHKGLLGPLGTGGLIIRPGIEDRLLPLREGGTGSASERDVQPDTLPDRYESGSHNAIGIAGLSEGIAWLLDQANFDHQRELTTTLIDGLQAIEPVTILQPDADRVPVVSLIHDTIDAATLAMLLEQEGILARAGLHCAPHAHRALGTLERGALRLSAGPFTSLDDVNHACRAIADLTVTCQ